MSPLLPTLLALTLSAAPDRPAAGERDGSEPPPGSASDQALWRELRGATNASVMALARIAQASYRLRYGGYYEGLDRAAAAWAPDRAQAARSVRARLADAARRADDALPKGKVGVRACRYRLLSLTQHVQGASEDERLAAELPRVREDARRCVEKLEPLARIVGPRADDLERALAEASALLGSERGGAPPRAAGPPEVPASASATSVR